MFTKFFFPHQATAAKIEGDDTESEDEGESAPMQGRALSMGFSDTGGIGDTGSVMSSSTTRGSVGGQFKRELSSRIKETEQVLMKKLSSNWVSVRKAFLDIDTDYDGFITAEDFAGLIGGTKGFDFNILKMLIKMKTNQSAGGQARINYTQFSKWFGQVIEPAEAFYFRHDSIKNPQYEKNQQKTIA